MENVRTTLHDTDIFTGRVTALAVSDWIGEAISELSLGSQQVGLDELDHAVVFDQIVLQRRCRQDNSTLSTNATHRFRCG